MAISVDPKPTYWRAWCLAARPKTLPAAVAPVVVGSALAAAEGRLRLSLAVAALAGAVWLQIVANLVNDYADFKKGADTAERLGPPRASQNGWLRPRQVAGGAVVAGVLAVLCGVYLARHAGWPVVAVGLAGLAAGFLYTGGPRPFGYHGLGDIFVFLFFGVAAVCGSYFVQTAQVTPLVVAASISMGCLATAILVVNNLRDRVTDSASGKRTLAVRYGAAFARGQYVGLLCGAYAVPLGAAIFGGAGIGWLLPLVSVPLAWRSVQAIRHCDGAGLNPWLARTALVETLFGFSLAVGVLL